MGEFEYLELKNAFEDKVYAAVPEIMPEGMFHDGWDGAAGVEHRDGHYEAYPHNWDSTLGWCRLKWSMMLHDAGAKRFLLDYNIIRDPYDEAEDIPMELFGRAITRWY